MMPSVLIALLLALAAAGAPVAGQSSVLAASDTVPPGVGVPRATPVPGSRARPAGVAVRVTWTATDASSGVARSVLHVSEDGGRWARVRLAGSEARHATVTVRPRHEARFRVRAVDRAGNRSSWVYGPPTDWRLRSQQAAGVTTSGAWATIRHDDLLGGTALRSREAGASIRFAFHGSAVAWIGRLSARGGSAVVFLDGERTGTVSTTATSRRDRRIVVARSWTASGDHELLIQVAGTAGHPDVVVDGFVVGSDPPTGPVLVGAGDIAQCGEPSDELTAELLDRIPGRVFAAGDTVYPDGTSQQYRDCYEPGWGRVKDRTWPVIGNREYRSAGAGPYFDYFGQRAGRRGEGWYAHDLGTWRIYVLNSNCNEVGCGAGSTQLAWLRNDLGSHPRACIAAIMHHPLVSSGLPGTNTAVRPLWEALHGAGADIVLAGHDHAYERFAPLSPAGTLTGDGARQFVVGTGGYGLNHAAATRAGSEARNSTAWGVLSLTLAEGRYAWRFVPVAGQTYTDAGVADCR